MVAQVARQERDKQRLMQAKARADEGCSGDAAGLPGPEGDGSRPVTAKTSTEGSSRVAAQAPPDGDEVRQCLEYLVSVCIADGDADGDGGGMAGLGSEAVAVEKEADASEIGTGETAGNAAEALLPGFELSAKERKKVRYRRDQRYNNVCPAIFLMFCMIRVHLGAFCSSDGCKVPQSLLVYIPNFEHPFCGCCKSVGQY